MIVVTGSSGLLGRHVVAALAQAGHAVRGVDAVPPVLPLAAHVTADLTDPDAALAALQGAVTIVHAAAIPRPTGHSARMVFTTNVALAFNVVEAAVTLGVRHLVHASSFSVLGFPFHTAPLAPAYLPVDEGHPYAPQDAYALSKLVGEEVVAAAVRRGALAATSLRMPWLQTPETFAREVGPHQHDHAAAARDLWSYLDARDAGEAFRLAVERPATAAHRILFIAAADTYMREPTEHLARAAFPGIALRRPLVGTQAAIDCAAAHAALGFVPRHSWRDI